MIYNPGMYTVHRLPNGYPTLTDNYSLTSRLNRWLTVQFFCVKSTIIICIIHCDFSISAGLGRNVAVNLVGKKIIFMHAC